MAALPWAHLLTPGDFKSHAVKQGWAGSPDLLYHLGTCSAPACVRGLGTRGGLWLRVGELQPERLCGPPPRSFWVFAVTFTAPGDTHVLRGPEQMLQMAKKKKKNSFRVSGGLYGAGLAHPVPASPR